MIDLKLYRPKKSSFSVNSASNKSASSTISSRSSKSASPSSVNSYSDPDNIIVYLPGERTFHLEHTDTIDHTSEIVTVNEKVYFKDPKQGWVQVAYATWQYEQKHEYKYEKWQSGDFDYHEKFGFLTAGEFSIHRDSLDPDFENNGILINNKFSRTKEEKKVLSLKRLPAPMNMIMGLREIDRALRSYQITIADLNNATQCFETFNHERTKKYFDRHRTKSKNVIPIQPDMLSALDGMTKHEVVDMFKKIVK